jgi:acyl carrier protein
MRDLVLDVVAELNPTLPEPVKVDQGEAAALYGRSGVLDSIALVSLVVALEQLIEEEYGVSVSLADERAVSQSSSPFRTVGTLAKYAESRVQEAKRA